MRNEFIVTIDGPAGSGKSTIADMLAKKNGFFHIDTGALYRAIGYIFKGKPRREDVDSLCFFIKKTNRIEIFYNNENIENFIRSEQCGMLASNVAKIEYVRDFVNSTARKIAKNGRFVIDGRDCGSVIFPDADLKIFLNADIDERAKRRAKEDEKDVNKIKREIEKRDEQDKHRDIAPLSKPKDAVEIDTTGLSVDEVYKVVKQLIEDGT